MSTRGIVCAFYTGKQEEQRPFLGLEIYNDVIQQEKPRVPGKVSNQLRTSGTFEPLERAIALRVQERMQKIAEDLDNGESFFLYLSQELSNQERLTLEHVRFHNGDQRSLFKIACIECTSKGLFLMNRKDFSRDEMEKVRALLNGVSARRLPIPLLRIPRYEVPNSSNRLKEQALYEIPDGPYFPPDSLEIPFP